MDWLPFPVQNFGLVTGCQRIKNNLLPCEQGEPFSKRDVFLTEFRHQEKVMLPKKTQIPDKQ
jgi:hypothetical protein